MLDNILIITQSLFFLCIQASGQSDKMLAELNHSKMRHPPIEKKIEEQKELIDKYKYLVNSNQNKFYFKSITTSCLLKHNIIKTCDLLIKHPEQQYYWDHYRNTGKL